MTATEYVVLVDENDTAIGTAPKLVAHEQCLLHRAFSVFIFKQPNYLLLQQRALHKYHSPGLWTNTCCSHPRAGESVIDAGKRRLNEELGFATELTNLGWFHYTAHFDNGLAENEIDHVLVGSIDEQTVVTPNQDEVHAIQWITLDQLHADLQATPERFTPWLAKALQVVVAGSCD